MKLLRTSRDRHGRHKNSLLFSLLGLLIVVEALTVFAVLASQRYATDQALHEHTYELLQNVVDETRENAVAYLQQAQDSVALAAGVFEANLLTGDEPERLETYFLEQLRVLPQVDALYFGDTRGNFIFSKRSNTAENEGFLTKFIRNTEPAETRVIRVYRDADFTETSRKFDPQDEYDPRLRPWFQGARASETEIWTDPYVFYTSQLPGLTVARAVRNDEGHLIGVIGADIELSALSQFLQTQRVGASGAAFIVYSNGDVLAHPDAAVLAHQEDPNNSRMKRLDDLDAITARAGKRLMEQYPELVNLHQAHFDDFEIEQQRYLSMFVPLLNQGNNLWVMGVYAPEDEMAYTIRKGQRESIYLGVAMSLLSITAAVLIGLLILKPIYALQRQAREDPLTGLYNRRSFDEVSSKKLATAVRNGQPVSAIMIDIDCFKPINDDHGHGIGDEVLLAVSRRIFRGLSDDDLLSRHGGEEFAILLPDASLDQGVIIAERLRQQVDESPIKTSIGPLHVTISLGVAELRKSDETVRELLDHADKRLLIAKRRGRNCVVDADA